MENYYLNLVVAVLTGFAVVVPFIIPWIERRDKLKKTIYLIELLKTKEELKTIIEIQKQKENSPILIEKLSKNLKEIDEDIYAARRKYIVSGFIIIISIEIFFLFNMLTSIILGTAYKTGLLFLEGILFYPLTRVILLLAIITTSFIITLRFKKYIKDRVKQIILYNITMVVVFNVILILFGTFTFFFLKYSDDFIPWY